MVRGMRLVDRLQNLIFYSRAPCRKFHRSRFGGGETHIVLGFQIMAYSITVGHRARQLPVHVKNLKIFVLTLNVDVLTAEPHIQ